MSNSLLSERLLTLGEARRLPYLVRNGRPVSLTTLIRWARVGIDGIKLEVVRRGRGLSTTEEAVERFFARLTELEFSRG